MPRRRTHSNPAQPAIDPAPPAIEPNAVVAETSSIEALAITQIASDLEPDPSSASAKPPAGKLGLLVDMIAARAGATIDELVGATGWQPHTIRAAFSRLRRRGFATAITTDADGRKAYRLDQKVG